MTKPTVTAIITKYALFRKDSSVRTTEYALQGKTYNSLAEAIVAKGDMLASLPIGLQSLIDVFVVTDSTSEPVFGNNPVAWLN